MPENLFKLQINLTKSYVGNDGNHYLEGIASGPEVDLTDERMSPDALTSKVGSIKRCLIEFRDAHKSEWNDDLGEVVELSLTDDNHLFYKSKLDMNLNGSKDLWYRAHTLGKKYGVSIGGAVLKAGMEYIAELGRQVYTYFDVDLYEISITRQVAYRYSFANAVLKSLPKKEEPMTNTTEGQVETTTTESTDDEAESAVEITDATGEADSQVPQVDATEAKADTDKAAAEDADAEAGSAEAEVETEGDEVEKSTESTETMTEEVAKSAAFGDWAEIGLELAPIGTSRTGGLGSTAYRISHPDTLSSL